MKMSCLVDHATSGYRLSGFVDAAESEAIGNEIVRRTIETVSDAIAELFLGDHLQDVLTMLNPEAVANLAVADAAGAIRETLHKKLPDKVLEVVRTEREVYQRGVFGGMTRIR